MGPCLGKANSASTRPTKKQKIIMASEGSDRDISDEEDSNQSEESSAGSESEDELPPGYDNEESKPPGYSKFLKDASTTTPSWLIDAEVRRERERAQLAEARLSRLEKEFETYKNMHLKDLEHKIQLLHNSLNNSINAVTNVDKEAILQRAEKAELELGKSLESLHKAYELLKEKDQEIQKLRLEAEAKNTLKPLGNRKSKDNKEDTHETPHTSVSKRTVTIISKDRDPGLLQNQIAEATQWIESMLNIKFSSDDFVDNLHTGVELCNLINKIKPRSIPSSKINKMKINFMYIENINNFIQTCEKIEITNLFKTEDLIEGRNLHTVVDCILELKKKHAQN